MHVTVFGKRVNKTYGYDHKEFGHDTQTKVRNSTTVEVETKRETMEGT